MAENSKTKSGNVPRQIVDKNGKLTTVYVKPDHDDTGSDAVSASLSSKSARKSVTQTKIDPYGVANADDEELDELLGELDDDPQIIHDSKKRAQIATMYMNAVARDFVLEEKRQILKQQLINEFTDDEIAEGDIVMSSEDDSFEVFVKKEKGEFFPERSGLTYEEKASCTHFGIDIDKARRQFPDVVERATISDGTLSFVSGQSDGDAKRVRSEVRLRYKDWMNDLDDQDVVTQYQSIHDEQQIVQERREVIEDVVSEIVAEDGDLPSSAPTHEVESVIQSKMDPVLVNPSNGAQMSVVAGSTTDRPTFRAALYQRRLHDFQQTERWHTLTEPEQQKFLESRVRFDMSHLENTTVDVDRVKQKYPEKYEAGRPVMRQLYYNDLRYDDEQE